MTNLKILLNQFSPEELNVLRKIVNCKEANIDDVLKSFRKLILPVGGILQPKLSYKKIMERIAAKRKIDLNMFLSESEIELHLFKELYSKELANLSDTEKAELVAQLEKQGLNKSQIASVTSLAALGAAQASGFAVYLLASSTVGAISSALGIALPFAFYTTMSSVISVFIGPLGLLVLGYSFYRSFKHVQSWEEAKILMVNTGKELKNLALGNYERAEMAFKFIASIRILKLKMYQENIEKEETEIQTKKNQLSNLQSTLATTKEHHNNIKIEIEDLSELMASKNKELNNAKTTIGQKENEVNNVKLQIDQKKLCVDKFHKEKELLNN